MTEIVAFVEAYKDRFGVEPMCRVLSEHDLHVAPSTVHAHRHRQPSTRARRDAGWTNTRVHQDNFAVYGARMVWRQLNREGIRVARCTVERRMRALGLVGARLRAWTTTTSPEPGVCTAAAGVFVA